jgi:hypothetical protein
MKTRRDFFKSAAVFGVLGATGLPLANAAENKIETATGENDRRYWVSVLEKIARPVLENLARRELKKTMPRRSRTLRRLAVCCAASRRGSRRKISKPTN